MSKLKAHYYIRRVSTCLKRVMDASQRAHFWLILCLKWTLLGKDWTSSDELGWLAGPLRRKACRLSDIIVKQMQSIPANSQTTPPCMP